MEKLKFLPLERPKLKMNEHNSQTISMLIIVLCVCGPNQENSI